MFYSGDLNSFGGAAMTFNSTTNMWLVTIEASADDASSNFLFRDSDVNFNNKWSRGESVSFGAIETAFWQGGDTRISVTAGKRYTFALTNVSNNNNGSLIVHETDNFPQSFASLSHTSMPVSPGQDLVVTVNLNGSKSPQERVFIRYTKDAFASSFVVEATGSGDTWSTATATIPGSFNTPGANVIYYAYSTTVAANNNTDHDLVTLNFGNNGGSNYTYTVASSWTTTAAGNWTNTASWASGAVPVENQPVTVAHNLTLDTDVSVSSFVINVDVTFTASDATARELTIAKSTAGDQETFTNNGTWSNGTGGSTVVFTGEPNSGDARHQIRGTGVTFDNVIVRKTGGTNNVGASFGENFSVSNTLRIGNGGFISTDPPEEFYGDNATLEFNQGEGATYEVNENDRTWSTSQVPNSIRILSGTVVLNRWRSFSGLLTIESGAALNVNGNANLGQLTIEPNASLINRGTLTGNNIVYQRTFAGHSRWVMVSSPAANAPIAGAAGLLQNDQIWTQGFPGSNLPGNTAPNVRLFDEEIVNPANNMRFLAPSANFEPGRGYIAYLYQRRVVDDPSTAIDFNNAVFSISGTVNPFTDGSFSFPVTYTDGQGNGWNLIGNPFPSYLEWNSSDWTRTNVGNYFYVWNPSEGVYQARTFNDGFTPGTGEGGAGEDVTDLGNNRIAPFQGFWVRATGESPALSVTSAAQTATSTSFLSKSVELPRITLRTESSDGLKSMTSLFFSEDASLGIDANDAFQLTPLTGTYVSMFTKIGEESALINNLPIDFESYEFPLYVISVENGRYSSASMSMNWELSSTVPQEWVIELIDQQTGQTIDIQNTESYQFILDGSLAKKRPDINKSPIITTSEGSRFLIRLRRAETTNNALPSDLPASVTLAQNFPNPFNPTTNISYTLPENGHVRLAVYNLLGQQVAALVDGAMSAGSHTVTFDASSLSSGVYVYRLEASGQVLSKRMTLMK